MSGSPYPGFWRSGDDPGDRRFADLHGPGGGGFELESGATLANVRVAYETWGTLNAERSNAVLIEHALTGDSHVAGAQSAAHPSPGWWDPLVGPGRAIDTDRYYVVCPNVLGGCQGTTGPSSLDETGQPYGSRFPVITIRDQVDVEVALSDHLGIDRWAAIIGGSMGAMRALEWCVGHPERVRRAIVLAVGAAASAQQIALSALQVRAIEMDPDFADGDYYDTGARPTRGLGVARGLGQLSYRTADEFEARFGRDAQGDEEPLERGRYQVESYLEYHGDKLARRFDPNSYVVLSEAMNHHDVGRGRGGIEAALDRVRAQVSVVGISSDWLYPLTQQVEIANALGARGDLHVVESASGHDGFLSDVQAVGAVVASVLSDPL